MQNLQDPSEIFRRATHAQPQIRALSLGGRLNFLSRLKSLILEKRESIIDRIQAETRKSRSDALMSEIFSTVEHLDFLLKRSEKYLSDRKVHTPLALMGKQSQVWFEPLGTILVISPWNYPFFQAVVPCTLSFVCGNATVYKPSEHTPLKDLMESLFKDAGLQEDWIQVVYGDGTLGRSLIDQKPDKIFFTGSTQTGKAIMAQASQYLIPVELELGGKDPMIVFEDVTLERAVSGAIWGGLTNCGQSCTSVERIFVHSKVYAEFVAECKKQLAHLTQGVDSDGSKDMGEMTASFQVETVRKQLLAAQSANAKITSFGTSDSKFKIAPTLVEIPKDQIQSPLFTEETFGPVLAMTSFETEAEVVEKANQSEYGLSASVWSKDLERAKRVARALKVGNVSINNVMLTEGNSALPFGGVKGSGMGRFRGEFGFYSFSNIKAILIDKDSKKQEANWYPFTAAKYALFTKMMLALFSRGPIALLSFVLSGMGLEALSQKLFKNRSQSIR